MQKSKELAVCQEKLKNLLDYDPETGFFTWKVNGRGIIKAGLRAGTLQVCKEGRCGPRRYIMVSGYRYLEHRLAFMWMTGRWPADVVDHKNGDSSDNSWANLREATKCQNQKNRRVSKNNKTGFKGVIRQTYCKKSPYKAVLGHNGVLIHLGSFATAEEAAEAYAKAMLEKGKEFARIA